VNIPLERCRLRGGSAGTYIFEYEFADPNGPECIAPIGAEAAQSNAGTFSKKVVAGFRGSMGPSRAYREPVFAAEEESGMGIGGGLILRSLNCAAKKQCHIRKHDTTA
jgi:hypothetical protein